MAIEVDEDHTVWVCFHCYKFETLCVDYQVIDLCVLLGPRTK